METVYICYICWCVCVYPYSCRHVCAVCPAGQWWRCPVAPSSGCGSSTTSGPDDSEVSHYCGTQVSMNSDAHQLGPSRTPPQNLALQCLFILLLFCIPYFRNNVFFVWPKEMFSCDILVLGTFFHCRHTHLTTEWGAWKAFLHSIQLFEQVNRQ